MKLRGKRWIYEVGGRRLVVENAWSWSMWAQERVLLDGVCVRATGAFMTTERSFTLPESETRLNAPLHVNLWSGLFRIDALVLLGDAPVDPEAVQFGQWRGRKGEWPGEDAERAPRVLDA